MPITVECDLRINGAAPGANIVTSSGLGATVRVESFTLSVERGDVVTICDHVTVNNEFHEDCFDAYVHDPIPEVVYEAGEIFTDSACDEIGALDGTALDQPPAFDIRSDGDIYAIGGRVWVYDCPTDGDTRRRYRAIHDFDPPIPDNS